MTNKPIRLGMIGCGLISHAHGLAARKSRHQVSFVACMSRTLASASSWAEEYGCQRAYDDLDEMLAAEQLDGVVIATWPSLHCEQILSCINAGVAHILCEKALVTSGAEAMQVRQAAARADVNIVEGYMYRHHPATQRLEQLAGRESNGKLDSIHAVFSMLDDRSMDCPVDSHDRSWRRRADAGGGVPFDFLCYPVDAACHFAGAMPLSAQATASLGPHGTVDRLAGLLAFDNGVFAILESSRHTCLDQGLELRFANTRLSLPFAWSPPANSHIDITSSNDFLKVEMQTEVITHEQQRDGRLVAFPVFTRQMDNFADVIQGRAEPLVRAEGAVINAYVIDALLASVESGQRVEINFPAEFQNQAMVRSSSV